MCDSDDEDVIFEGSPLHNTLINSGSLEEELNFEVLNRDGTDRDQGTGQPISVKADKTGVKKKDVQIVTTLLQSTTLDEDDSDFLHSYLELPQPADEARPARKFTIGLCALIMPVVCAYWFTAVLSYDSDWRSLLVTTTLMTLTVAALPVFILYWSHYTTSFAWGKALNVELSVVKEYVKSDEAYISVLRRSLRMIQEAELIARGFTLVSQKSPVSRLEAGSSLSRGTRQCPGLRKLVFTVAREGIYSLRELTKQLITLSSDLVHDMTSSYLAFEPVQSYGPCLQQDCDDSGSELYNITDGFSISALKGICHLLQLHQSEFIKALALSYSHNFKHPGSDNTEVLALLVPASERLQAWTDTVSESFNFHSCSLLSRKPPAKKISKPTSGVEEVYTAIHSLDLHLQSALTRVRTFSTWLEAKVSDSEVDNSGFHGDDLVNSIMQPIRAELDSCRCCWEEGLTRLEKMLGKHKPDAGAEGGTEKLHMKEDLQDSSSGQAKPIEDYIILDQVFEGYTDPSEMYQDEEDWDKPLTAEEKEKKKREKQEALRMLTELKSVISVRAVDWEKREKAALLRAHPELILHQSAAGTLADLGSVNQSADAGQVTVNQSSDEGQVPVNQSADAGQVTENQSIDKEKMSVNQPANATVGSREPETIKPHNVSGDRTSCDAMVNKEETDNTDTQRSGSCAIDNKLRTNDDSVVERKPLSYVTYQGVRRLRKSNMLDLSDSDSDDGYTCRATPNVEQEETSEYDKGTDRYKDIQRVGLPRLPFVKVKTQFGETDSDSDNELDGTKGNVEDYTEKPVLTLEERLRQFSGANLDMSSNIAAQAVARSRMMGGLTEATFGGETFGEMSSEEESET